MLCMSGYPERKDLAKATIETKPDENFATSWRLVTGIRSRWTHWTILSAVRPPGSRPRDSLGIAFDVYAGGGIEQKGPMVWM